MEREQAQQMKIGGFVLVAFIVFFMAIFALGREKNLFKPHVKLEVYFGNISGLKSSAPVRLAGVDIGVVDAIELPSKVGDKNIRVTMKIDSDVLYHIRADSEASIDSQGLLGDKLINITIGSNDSPSVSNGSTLRSVEQLDINAALSAGSEALTNIRTISRDLKHIVASYNTPEFEKDVKTTVHAAAMITDGISNGPGLIHDIIYNKHIQQQGHEVIKHVVELSSNLLDISGKVGNTVDHVDGVVTQVQKGPGLVHELIFHDSWKKVLDNVTNASSDISALTNTVRVEKGTLHDLIFEEKGKSIVADLTSAAHGIKLIIDNVNKGNGTLGGLIADPTVYEDIKLIVGNLRRNATLKALVRFSISHGDQKPKPTDE